MGEYSQPASRSYAILDDWLAKWDGDPADHYVDVQELANGQTPQRTTPQYFLDNPALNQETESRDADFQPTGIFVGNEADANSLYPVVGCLIDEKHRPPKMWYLAGNVVHPLRFARIYARYHGMRTQARQIRFVGYGANTSMRQV